MSNLMQKQPKYTSNIMHAPNPHPTSPPPNPAEGEGGGERGCPSLPFDLMLCRVYSWSCWFELQQQQPISHVHHCRHQHEAHNREHCNSSSTFSSSVKVPPLSLLFLLLLACMAFKLKGISFTSSSGRLRLRYSSKVVPFGMINDACNSSRTCWLLACGMCSSAVH